MWWKNQGKASSLWAAIPDPQHSMFSHSGSILHSTSRFIRFVDVMMMSYLLLGALRPPYSYSSLVPWNVANEFVNATSSECHPEIHGTACTGVRRGGCSQTQMIQQMRGKLYCDIQVYVIGVQKLCLHKKIQKRSPKYPAMTEIHDFSTFETIFAYLIQWKRKKWKEGR